MKVKEVWLVTIGTSVRTVFITVKNWYFITTHIVGDLDQITKYEFEDLVKNSKIK